MVELIIKNIKGKEYNDLIDFLFKFAKCDQFAFVVRLEETESTSKVLQLLEEHLVEKKYTNSWENTVTLEDVVALYRYKLNLETKEVLQSVGDSIYGWLHPKLPEDLMFYKKGKCLFSVCSHEGIYRMDEDLEKLWNKRSK